MGLRRVADQVLRFLLGKTLFSSLQESNRRIALLVDPLFSEEKRSKRKMFRSLADWKKHQGKAYDSLADKIKQCYQSHSETLDLRDPSVPSLPEHIFLPRVKHLKLSDEQFTSFLKNPSSLYSLTSIKSFSIGERDPVNVSGTLYESMIKDSLDRWVLEGNPQAAADRILSCFKKNPPR